MKSDKKKERLSFGVPTCLVINRPHRKRVSTLLTVLELITCHLSLVTVVTLAQSGTTGSIVGTVTDPNGAVIVGAEVTVTSLATGEERKATTDTEGNYAVPLLSPSMYRVRVAANGFNPALFDTVRVVITETTTLNAPLTVAGVIVDSVVVRAAPLIRTDGPAVLPGAATLYRRLTGLALPRWHSFRLGMRAAGGQA